MRQATEAMSSIEGSSREIGTYRCLVAHKASGKEKFTEPGTIKLVDIEECKCAHNTSLFR